MLLLIFHHQSHVWQNSGSRAKVLLANQMTGFFKTYYLKKVVNDEVIFGIWINIEVFYKFILLFWVFIARHVQNTQIRSLHIFALSPEKHEG